MGLRDYLSRVREYVLASFVPAMDHPSKGGMTGESAGTPDDEDDHEVEESPATEPSPSEETARRATDPDESR